jgi:hypothetical protein
LTSFRQALVDQNIQGRMNATIRTLVWGTLPAGYVARGFVGNLAGVPITIGFAVPIEPIAVVWLAGLRERPSAPL